MESADLAMAKVFGLGAGTAQLAGSETCFAQCDCLVDCMLEVLQGADFRHLSFYFVR
jgi:hypothetical protein